MTIALIEKIEHETKIQKDLNNLLKESWENELVEKSVMKKVWKKLFSLGFFKVTNFYGEFQLGLNFEKHNFSKTIQLNGCKVEVFCSEEYLSTVLYILEEHKEDIRMIKNHYIFI